MLLLVDLDGVVYRGDAPVPGIARLLATRVERGDDVVYVTNNSLRHRADYVDRLTSMGAPVGADHVVSSSRATALFLADLDPRPHRILAVGEDGLVLELRDGGFDVVPAGEIADWSPDGQVDGFEAAGRPDVVVVGLDLHVTYARIAIAADAVRRGAVFVATNRDPIYPTERGFLPGAGSIVAAVETAASVVPISIGKPAPLLLLEAARVVGAEASAAVMIGDSLASDVAAARAVGARSVLMLTGVATRTQLAALPADERPTEVAVDADELEAALDRLANSESGLKARS